MTDFTKLLLPDLGQSARALVGLSRTEVDLWLSAQPEPFRARVRDQGFTGKPGSLAWVDTHGIYAVLGVAEAQGDANVATEQADPWALAAAATQLPPGTYRLHAATAPVPYLGWLLAQHRPCRYQQPPSPTEEGSLGPRILLTPEVARIDRVVREAEAVARVRDWVDSPANHMGPAQIEAEARALAARHEAAMTVTFGEALTRDFPLIAAVGAAAGVGRGPRLIEVLWGDESHPRIAVVGKGVTFDTGGLDIKPSSGMRLMKKDMGGAAHALALAGMVMAERLPVRLHLLLPVAENAVGPAAMRPGDVYISRQGLSVEITNTDAEGRLVLADALTKAGESDPELILDFATLTGAARVALGPDLPALFANDDALAQDFLAAGRACGDPLWPMPLHAGYRDMLKSGIADLANAADGGFAGAITAALFLQRFVKAGAGWAHIDTFAWRPTAKPGRPKGGEALGLRAAFSLLNTRYRGS